MALSNFQYSWNGLTFGAGTDIQIVEESGLRSIPPVRSADIVKPRMDGAFAGFNYLGERIAVLTLAVTVTKDAPFETVVENIGNAFQPTFDPNGEQPLSFMYPGWSGARRVYGRVTKAGFPTNLNYSFHKLDSLPIEITCSDPLIYSDDLSTVSVALPTVNATPVTTLTANASIGATSITVASNGGFIVGMPVYINGVSATPAGYVLSTAGSTTINLASALTAAFTSGQTVLGSTFPINPQLTNLTATASSGGSALTVASNSGFYAGQTIYVGGATLETKVVASTAGSTTINLTTNLSASHAGPGTAPSTTLSANALAGDWYIKVTSTTNIVVGMPLLIAGAETRVVSAISGLVVFLTTQLGSNRSSGATVAGTAVGSTVYAGATFTPTSGGALLCDNVGNYKTYPKITIKGPVTNPTVTLASTGEYFTLTTTLTGSDSIVIDMQEGTVILNGTTTRYNTVAVGSTWFGLPPGGSSIQLSSTDSSYPTGNLFTVDYRSAWSWS